MEDLRIARTILLSMIVLMGVPGNCAALIFTLRSIRQKQLNILAYLHLALVDFLLCSVHAIMAIILESFDYYNYYNAGKNDKDLGGWEPVLKFLYLQVGTRLYMSCTFISTLALTFIAGYRTWRVFFPFGRQRKLILVCIFASTDIAVVLFALFYQLPNRREPGSNLVNTTTINSWNDFNANFSIQDIAMSERIETMAPDSGIGFVNSSSVLTETSKGLLSSTPMAILVGFIGAATILSVIFYLLICFKLRYDFQKSNFGEGSQRQMFLRRQLRHVITHVVLVAIMITTLLPAFLFTVIAGKPGTDMIRLMMTVAQVNSAINPYVYTILLPGNKVAIKTMCGCDCGSKDKTSQ